MATSKVVKYRKPISPIIWKSLVFLLIIYILILLLTYTNKEHITIYEVNNAKIADDAAWEGVIIRNEKIFKTKQAGYINYYNPAGNRIGVGDILYTIDSSGNISDLLADIDSSTAPSSEEITNMRSLISSFQDHFDFSNYSEVYDYHYDIENAVFEQSKGNLYSDLEKALQRSGQNNAFHKISAKQSGIISYTLDGMENLKDSNVNLDTFNQKGTLKKSQLREKATVKINSPVYKLVTDEKWSLVIPINQNYYEKLKDKTIIKVTIKKDSISFNAGLRLELRPDGPYAILSTDRFMERYINDRFLDIEFNLNSASGLKIPNSSILEKEFFLVDAKYFAAGGDGGNGFYKLDYKEDGTKNFTFVPVTNQILIKGKYYVSKDILNAGDILVNQQTQENITVNSVGKLYGVYRVNEGFCKFIRVEKIYENSEYTIISDETTNGLSLYDHIVVDPKLLNENDFIQ